MKVPCSYGSLQQGYLKIPRLGEDFLFFSWHAGFTGKAAWPSVMGTIKGNPMLGRKLDCVTLKVPSNLQVLSSKMSYAD